VLVDVSESCAELSRIATALPGANVCIVRLRASTETLAARVRLRETGVG
jgi:hypothetical protein